MSKNLKEVLTIGRYFKKKFGQKVYKIPISISGFTCPNIDGTKAKGGCSFCENDSFSPNLQEKKTKFKLNPNMELKSIFLIFNLLQILMHHFQL